MVSNMMGVILWLVGGIASSGRHPRKHGTGKGLRREKISQEKTTKLANVSHRGKNMFTIINALEKIYVHLLSLSLSLPLSPPLSLYVGLCVRGQNTVRWGEAVNKLWRTVYDQVKGQRVN